MSERLDPKQIKQIGHKVRKPLVSLINTADLLIAGLEGDLAEQVRRDIEMIKKNAEDALVELDFLIDTLRKL